MSAQPDTVALLSQAAELAEKAAAAVTPGPWSVVYYDGPQGVWGAGKVLVADCSNDETRGELNDPYLIAASGPDHWRAVAAMLRAMFAVHQPFPLNPETGLDEETGREPRCKGECGVKAWPAQCPSLAALHPLAELIVQQLGDPS